MKASICFASLLAALAGCDWRVFDDLQDDVWVDSQTTPGAVGSRSYGAAIQGVPSAGDGATIAVLGRSGPTLSALAYDADGDAAVVLNDSGAREIFGRVGQDFDFDPVPAFVREPDGSRVAVAYISGTFSDDDRNIKVSLIDASDLENAEPEQLEPATLAGVRLPIDAYGPVTSASFAGSDYFLIGAIGGPEGEERTRVYLVDLTDAAPTDRELTACNLPVGEQAFAVGFGPVGDYPDALGTQDPLVPGGDVLVLTAPVEQLGGAPTGAARIRVLVGGPELTPDGEILDCVFADFVEPTVAAGSGLGSQLLVDDLGGEGVRVIATSTGDSGEISIFDFSGGTPTLVESREVPDLQQVAVGDLDGDGVDELIAGQPNLDVDGVANAGQVTVFGTDLEPVASPLHDATPDASQFYGTAVTVAPFTQGGETRNLLVVGSDGEVFTYFRTELYDDVRAGRE